MQKLITMKVAKAGSTRDDHKAQTIAVGWLAFGQLFRLLAVGGGGGRIQNGGKQLTFGQFLFIYKSILVIANFWQSINDQKLN